MDNNENSNLTFGEKPIVRFRQKTRHIIRNITIEPLLLVHSLAYGIVCLYVPTLYFDKICRVGSPTFGNWNGTGEYKTWNETLCNEIDNGEHEEEQNYVQETYANINLVVMFIKTIPPIIFSLFIGPWSDKCGRKVLMILPMTGYIFFYIWMIICTVYDELNAEYLMLEVFAYWPGGWMCMFLGYYSYISDISTPANRAIRIGILDCIFSVGFTVALGISGPLLSAFGYPGLFGISAVIQFLGMLYGIFFVKESRELNEKRSGEKRVIEVDQSSAAVEKSAIQKFMSTLSEIFTFKNVKESFNVAFQKREGGIGHVVVLLIAIFSLYMLAGMGIGVVSYPYIRKMFDWESEEYFTTWYSTFSSVTSAINFISYLTLPIMIKLLLWHDLTIVTICIISNLMYCIAVLMAKTQEMLYVASFLNIMAMMTTTPIRAHLTKLVGPDDVGKVFACVAASQALIDFLAPLYNLLYKYTLEWHPGFCYCLSALFLIIMIFMTLYCRWFSIKWTKKMDKKKMYGKGDVVYMGNPDIPCAPRFRSIHNDLSLHISSNSQPEQSNI